MLEKVASGLLLMIAVLLNVGSGAIECYLRLYSECGCCTFAHSIPVGHIFHGKSFIHITVLELPKINPFLSGNW